MDTFCPESFWMNAWKSVDRRRIADQIAHLGAGEDAIIGFLKARGAAEICDAGCGSGAYARKLALHGFRVSGFDLSPDAAAIAGGLLAESGCAASPFLAADMLHAPYPDDAFDAVVARDVIDHMPLRDAVKAVREMLRITRRGGCLLLTLDAPDEEYRSRAHEVNVDGDYLFTDGKWSGMVFHPYAADDLPTLAPGMCVRILDADDGLTVAVEKT